MRLRKNLLAAALTVLAATAAFPDQGAPDGPGRFDTPLINTDGNVCGEAGVWNSSNKLKIAISPREGWLISRADIYYDCEDVPVTRGGQPKYWQFPDSQRFKKPKEELYVERSLSNDLDFAWGMPFADERERCFALHLQLVRYVTVKSKKGRVRTKKEKTEAWAFGANEFPNGKRPCWWTTYELVHPRMGQFVDSPVQGLTVKSPTYDGETGDEGGFEYFPGETVDLYIGSHYIGSAPAGDKVTPLDVFENAELQDKRVANMARLLQSLDADADPKGRISITDEVVDALDAAMGALGLYEIDFTDDEEIDDIIDATIDAAADSGLVLVEVTAADALDNLKDVLTQTMVRKNVSKEPDYANSKQKLDIMPMYVPSRPASGVTYDANGDPIPYDVVYEYEDYLRDANGDVIRDENGKPVTEIVDTITRTEAKPIFVTYLEEVEMPEGSRSSSDVFTAVSWDDGQTFKRKNISRTADLSSFTLEAGEDFPGNCRAPNQKVAGNKVLITWTSCYARGGRPRYTIEADDDLALYDADSDGVNDYYVDDIWGVRGHQGSVDYDEVDEVADMGIGEIPYYALWCCRGIIVTQKEHDEDRFLDNEIGDLVWFKPERLTSARRDAFIPVASGVSDVGFAIAWQEDPDGLRPGKGKGGGVGWSGAISNKKTDIWYAWIAMEDFDVVDEDFVSGGTSADSADQAVDQEGRPKWLVPFSLPVRVSDNNMVNTDTLKVELDSAGYPNVQTLQDDDGNDYDTYVPLDEDDVDEGNAYGTTRYAYAARYAPDHAYASDTLNLAYIPGSGDDDPANLTWDSADGENYYDTYYYDQNTDSFVMDTDVRWYDFVNTEGSAKRVIVTADGRLLDGNTSASRANLSLQAYKDSSGVKRAWAILGYEETKGMGEPHADDTDGGHTDDGQTDGSGGGQTEKAEVDDYGKNVIYHTFRFDQPDLVHPGEIVNFPALTYDADGDGQVADTETDLVRIPIYWKDANGDDTTVIRQWRTEVARRVRFLAQAISVYKMGPSRTVLGVIFKQGRVGQGRPADVFLRRVVVPTTDGPDDNPYRFENFVDYQLNMTAVSTTEADLWLNPDAGWQDLDDGLTDTEKGWPKMVRWTQTVDNLDDESFFNVLTNAKGHRGFLDGDFLVLGYSWTPNWAAQRNGHDRYDFYIRRSFDGGQTWTSAPAHIAEYLYGTDTDRQMEGTVWPVEFKIPQDDGSEPVIETVYWGSLQYDANGDPIIGADGIPVAGPGLFEPARNTSRIKNNKYTVMDPRISSTPGSMLQTTQTADAIPAFEKFWNTTTGQWDTKRLKVNGVNAYFRYPEDEANRFGFFVSFGTGIQVASTGGDIHIGEAEPDDLYYSRSKDGGDSFWEIEWLVNPDSSADNAGEIELRWDWLAHGDTHQGEAQLRATPDASRMYAIWHQHSDPDVDNVPKHFAGDDVWFRRIGFLISDPVSLD